MVLHDGVADNEEYWLGNVKNDRWLKFETQFCQLILDLVTMTDRESLGPFDYWAWHLEPIWHHAAEPG